MKKFVIGLLIIILVSVFYFFDFLKPVETAVSKLFDGPLAFVRAKSILRKDIYYIIKNKEEIFAAQKEMERLLVKINELEIENFLLASENSELRKQLSFFRTNKNYKWVNCNVIGNTFESHSSSITINCGTEDGIEAGQAVVVGEGVYVGKVQDIKNNYATVRLITDQKSKTGAMIMNKEMSKGVLEGGFGVGVQLKLLPENDSINEKQLVFTSGFEGTIPKGLIIGNVETAQKEKFEPFQTAIVKPILDLNELTIVSVVRIEK